MSSSHKYMVMGEISLMSAALRRSMRFSHQNEEHETLIRSFSSLKDILSRQSELSDSEPNVYFSPFLDVMRSEDINGTVTAMALNAVAKFLHYGLIDHRLESAAGAAESVADAVTRTRFIGTDASSDEVVLMKILHVMRSLLMTHVGCLLSNESVCELIQSCIRICFEARFGDLLRKTAEQTLGEMVQLLFSRLPQFSEGTKYQSQKKLKVKGTGGMDHRSSKKSQRSVPVKKARTPTRDEAPFSISSHQPEVTTPTRPDVVPEVPLGKPEVIEVSKPDVPLPKEEVNTSEIGSRVNESGDGPSEKFNGESGGADGVEHVEEVGGDTGSVLSESVEIVNPESIEGSLEMESHVIHLSGSVASLNEIETHDDSIGEPPSPKVDVDKEDFVNPRGVRFTPTAADPIVPYGLPCVRELLRFMSTLICPHEPHNNSEAMVSIGLDLLTVAMETGGHYIGQYSSLLSLVKDDMCRNLLALLSSDRVSVLVAAMRVCFLMFEALRPHLKFQLESYLRKLTELIVHEGGPKSNYEVRELAIDAVVSLWRIPGFVTELYLNYDCDLYCSNLFEDLTNVLSKTAFPVTAIYSVHHLSLEALLAVIDSVETHCHFMMVNGQKRDHLPPLREDLMLPVAASAYQLAAAVDTRPPSEERIIEEKPLPALPSHEELMAIKYRKKLLHQGTEHFNVKPSKGVEFLQEHHLLPTPFSAEKVAQFIRTNYQLDKTKIGDYISNRKNVELLRAFVQSFNFVDTRIDEALRMYLETFRLPGEAQPISLLLEHFADHWHRSNQEPFASADAAFTLAYAIIMLNVDQHNHNVKKQSTPMTADQFVKNLKSVNGGSDFECQLLVDMYNAIRSDEIVMPAEQTGLVKDNYLWKVLLKRGSSPEGLFRPAPAGSLDHDVFTLAWSPTLAALSYLLDKSVDDTLLIQKLMSGYRKCATIAAHYAMSDVFDHLIQALYKFTGISSAENQLAVLQSLGADQRAQLTAKMMFTLAHKHGDVMKEGWKNTVDCMLILYKCRLMPATMTMADDFVEPRGYVSIAKRTDDTESKVEQGLFSSFVSYITSSESAAQKEQEMALRKGAESCVINFHPEFIFSESQFLRSDSLEELVRVLIGSCAVPGSHSFVNDTGYDEETTVFALELLIKVVLKNKDRVQSIWVPVRDHLYSLVMGAATGDYGELLTRSVVGMLRLSIRLCKGDSISSQVLHSLAMLLLLKPHTLRFVSRQIVYALHELLRTSASCISSREDWQIVFALMSCAGAGLKPNPTGNSAMMLDSEILANIAAVCADAKANEYDSGVQSDSEMGGRSTKNSLSHERGYTSDSELINNTKKPQPESPQFSTNVAGSWILVGQEEPGSPVKGSVNQYTITLSGCELLPHDPYAMTKAAHSLTQLVRDSSQHISTVNVEGCIQCIRVFAEASLHSKSKDRSRGEPKSPRKGKPPVRSPSPLSESDSDMESVPGAPPEYQHISIQLLDVMHTLHTSCNRDKLFSDPGELWSRCWCPLLQGIARLCCDTRKLVRTAALTYLQRALLVHDLHVLKAEEWEGCFNRVLFPLLAALLEKNIYPSEPSVAEETRVRVNTLLSKVFLQHLTPLLTLPTFTALWLTIVDFMDRFMNMDQGSDLLMDAIPESLKNMLLVMDTAGVFRTEDGKYTELWNVTWDRISPFLPALKDELFREPEPPAPPPPLPMVLPDEHSATCLVVPGAPSAASAPVLGEASSQPPTSQHLPEEANLPPVMSLEEALRPPRRPTPLTIGGILLQETPLAPSTHPGYMHTAAPQSQQPPPPAAPSILGGGQFSYGQPQQQMSSHQQNVAMVAPNIITAPPTGPPGNSSSSSPATSPQHYPIPPHLNAELRRQSYPNEVNTSLAQPAAASMGHTPSQQPPVQYHPPAWPAQIQYQQYPGHPPQYMYRTDPSQGGYPAPPSVQQTNPMHPANIPVYPGQLASSGGQAGPSYQTVPQPAQVPLFYSTGSVAPTALPSPPGQQPGQYNAFSGGNVDMRERY